MYNENCMRSGRKIYLIMDNLSSHFPDYDKHRLWKNNPDRQSVVFTDNTIYSNLTLIYIPPRTTSRLQTLDMGFFNFCQAKYRLWLNKQLFDKKAPSKLESVNKVYELLKSVPVKFVSSCWNRTEIQVN